MNFDICVQTLHVVNYKFRADGLVSELHIIYKVTSLFNRTDSHLKSIDNSCKVLYMLLHQANLFIYLSNQFIYSLVYGLRYFCQVAAGKIILALSLVFRKQVF